ncbi:phage tail length tape measure family protein [Mesorhizobium sp.]|uniref:phage tail length tape measure family protein n=1 Tax=Mesorhizobium sp. TaxID=1871066 RepID=UPI000FE74E6C|nr:phage tail length tape measure family protein [Mesorhizobium sp.]RWC58924.1 MAG: hypothetical protein EOS56_18620 [Mesorhizobium sp.]RWC66536.1 MAG: hypothetical protein EOS29_03975 [Mesorhizobium sp.]
MSLNLALVISGEASGAKAAADQTATAVRTVGVAAAQTSATMVAANDQAVASAQRVTAALVGQTAAQQQLQAGVERMIAAGSATDDATYRQRAADVEAYGNSLDALRAKYNPLFAVEQEHLSRLQGIDQALKVGAISEVEHANAVAISTAVYQRQVAGLGNVGNAAKLTSNQLLNLSRQGNDVVTMWLLGAPAMQIFASQAGQVYGALQEGPGGVGGSLKSLGTQLLALITRFPVITGLVVAGGAAFAAYELLVDHSTETLDKAVDAHGETIKKLRDAYQLAGDAAETYGARSIASIEAAQRRAEAALRASVEAQERSINPSVSDTGGFSGFGLLQRFGLAGEASLEPVALKFAAFQEPIRKLREEIAAGKPDYDAFQQWLNKIVATNPGWLRPIADELLGIIATAADGRDQLEAVNSSLNGITQNQLSNARVVSQLNGIEEAAKSANQETGVLLKMLNDMGSGLGGKADAKGDQIGGPAALDRAQANFDQSLDMWRRFGHDNDSGVDPNKPAKTPVDHSAERAANAYRDVLKSTQDRIDQMKVELQLTGQVGVAADTLRNYQELLGRATDKGRSIGEQQKAELHDRAEEMSKLAEATAAAKVQQDLLFDRQQMFRSPTEQDVYSTLRGANIDPTSAAGEAIASQIRYNDQLRDSRDLAGDFTSTLFGGLRSGQDEWEALGDAALTVLDKITDKLLNEVLDAIFQINSAGGGGGSILGAVGSLLGFGGGSSPAALADIASGSWGLFDVGGYTGPGPRHKPAGVVHAGEVVWNQDDVSRAGGVGVVEAMRLGRRGYLSGGAVEAGMAMPATGTYGGGPTWSGGSAQPQQVVLRIVNEEGPMFRSTIRSESQDVAVQVVRGNDAARADYYNAGGNPR